MQDLNTFDPTVEKLTALVAESAGIVEVNIDDPKQLEQVKGARLKLRDARVAIEKTGKKYREDALAYQRAVIQKEKSLIAIIEPEETRLKLFEKSAEIAKERRLRVQQLPERRKRLETAGLPVNETEILEMDSTMFEGHFNALMAEKNRKEKEAADAAAAAKQKELDEREAKLKEEERKAQAEKEAREREERARQEERDRIEREAREKKEREEREAKEKAEREAKEAAERKTQERYQTFLKENGWTPETADSFKEEKAGAKVVLWKKVGTFEL